MKRFLFYGMCLGCFFTGCVAIDEFDVTDVRHRIIMTSSGEVSSPDLVRLHSGEMLLVVRESPAGQDENGMLVCRRSTDNGNHWTSADTIVRSLWDCHDPSVVQLRDGLVIVNFHQIRRGETEGRSYRIGCFTVRSFDNGRTFTAPRMVRMVDWDWTATSDAILELNDGTLLMPLYGEIDGRVRSAVIISHDGGETWEDVSLIGGEGESSVEDSIEASIKDKIEYSDPSFALLQDGRIGCMLTTRGLEGYLAWSVSEDGGQSWPDPQNAHIHGSRADLHRTEDGILVCAFRDQTPTGVSMVRSYDGGISWVQEQLLSGGLSDGTGPRLASSNAFLFAVYDGFQESADGDRRSTAVIAAQFRIERLSPPQGFSGSMRRGAVDLRWNAVPGAAYYIVYRDSDPDFEMQGSDIDSAERIVTSVDPFYTDVLPDAGQTVYYRVTAVADRGKLLKGNGNESEPSSYLEIRLR